MLTFPDNAARGRSSSPCGDPLSCQGNCRDRDSARLKEQPMNSLGRARQSSREPTMPVWGEKHLRAATHAAGVALWSWNVDTDAITMDESAYDLWEISKAERKITFEILSKNIHPADLERVRSAFAATRAIVGAYEIDFRIMSGHDIRWISARGQGDDADIDDGVMFGIFLDVTQRKQAEEANELLAGEMSHRVKNLLQIATS